jgi:hypothetical protein
VVEPGPRRQRRLILWLRAVSWLTLAGAAAGTILPGRAGRWAATATVALLVAAPLLRTAWLAVRWSRLGDRRFAAAAVLVLVVAGSGVLLA